MIIVTRPPLSRRLQRHHRNPAPQGHNCKEPAPDLNLWRRARSFLRNRTRRRRASRRLCTAAPAAISARTAPSTLAGRTAKPASCTGTALCRKRRSRLCHDCDAVAHQICGGDSGTRRRLTVATYTAAPSLVVSGTGVEARGAAINAQS